MSTESHAISQQEASVEARTTSVEQSRVVAINVFAAEGQKTLAEGKKPEPLSPREACANLMQLTTIPEGKMVDVSFVVDGKDALGGPITVLLSNNAEVRSGGGSVRAGESSYTIQSIQSRGEGFFTCTVRDKNGGEVKPMLIPEHVLFEATMAGAKTSDGKNPFAEAARTLPVGDPRRTVIEGFLNYLKNPIANKPPDGSLIERALENTSVIKGSEALKKRIIALANKQKDAYIKERLSEKTEQILREKPDPGEGADKEQLRKQAEAQAQSELAIEAGQKFKDLFDLAERVGSSKRALEGRDIAKSMQMVIAGELQGDKQTLLAQIAQLKSVMVSVTDEAIKASYSSMVNELSGELLKLEKVDQMVRKNAKALEMLAKKAQTGAMSAEDVTKLQGALENADGNAFAEVVNNNLFSEEQKEELKKKGIDTQTLLLGGFFGLMLLMEVWGQVSKKS